MTLRVGLSHGNRSLSATEQQWLRDKLDELLATYSDGEIACVCSTPVYEGWTYVPSTHGAGLVAWCHGFEVQVIHRGDNPKPSAAEWHRDSRVARECDVLVIWPCAPLATVREAKARGIDVIEPPRAVRGNARTREDMHR